MATSTPLTASELQKLRIPDSELAKEATATQNMALIDMIISYLDPDSPSSPFYASPSEPRLHDKKQWNHAYPQVKERDWNRIGEESPVLPSYVEWNVVGGKGWRETAMKRGVSIGSEPGLISGSDGESEGSPKTPISITGEDAFTVRRSQDSNLEVEMEKKIWNVQKPRRASREEIAQTPTRPPPPPPAFSWEYEQGKEVVSHDFTPSPPRRKVTWEDESKFASTKALNSNKIEYQAYQPSSLTFSTSANQQSNSELFPNFGGAFPLQLQIVDPRTGKGVGGEKAPRRERKRSIPSLLLPGFGNGKSEKGNKDRPVSEASGSTANGSGNYFTKFQLRAPMRLSLQIPGSKQKPIPVVPTVQSQTSQNTAANERVPSHLRDRKAMSVLVDGENMSILHSADVIRRKPVAVRNQTGKHIPRSLQILRQRSGSVLELQSTGDSLTKRFERSLTFPKVKRVVREQGMTDEEFKKFTAGAEGQSIKMTRLVKRQSKMEWNTEDASGSGKKLVKCVGQAESVSKRIGKSLTHRSCKHPGSKLT